MLKFFRHNYPAQFAVVVLLAIIAWIPTFCNIPSTLQISNNNVPLYNLVVCSLHIAPAILTIIAFAASILSIFLFNSILNANQFSARHSTIASLMFVVCLSCSSTNSECFPFLIACPLILLTMQIMYSLIQTENPEPYLLNSGLFIGLASLVYYPSIVLILWILLVSLLYGYKQFRLYLIPIVGALVPYFFMLVICYFTRNLSEMFDIYSAGFLGLEIQKLSFSLRDNIIIIALALLFIIAIFKIKSSNIDNSIIFRKRLGGTWMLVVFSIFMMFLQKPIMCNGLIFITLATFYSMAFSTVKKSKIAEVILIVMIVGALSINYLPLFL